MKRVDVKQARRLHLARQRYYDAFKQLRAGETIAEFPFRSHGKQFIARDIRPYVGDEGPYGSAFYLTAWFMCHFGRGAERGPRICMLCFKDTGDPYLYSRAGFKGGIDRPGKITCLREHIFGLIWGGIWREDGTCDPEAPPLQCVEMRCSDGIPKTP